MKRDLENILPQTKFDTDKAYALVALGFPAVHAVIPQILEWLQDLNWPIARTFQPFLIGIGKPLSPYVANVLAGNDQCWKYNLLVGVVLPSPELAQTLRMELERMAFRPTPSEIQEEVNQVAIEILGVINGKVQA